MLSIVNATLNQNTQVIPGLNDNDVVMIEYKIKLLFVIGFVKIDPNHTGTEIHFTAEH